MTCVVAWTDATNCWMGADSYGADSSTWDGYEFRTPKMFRREIEGPSGSVPLLVGGTLSYRCLQIIEYHIVLPSWDDALPPLAWVITQFVPAYRKALTEHGWTKKDNEREVDSGWFILALRGNLFIVEPTHNVMHPKVCYAAVGCGGNFAMGALHALCAVQFKHEAARTPNGLLLLALQAAEAFSAGVRGSFTFLSTLAESTSRSP